VSAVACDELVVRFGSLTAVDHASPTVERGSSNRCWTAWRGRLGRHAAAAGARPAAPTSRTRVEVEQLTTVPIASLLKERERFTGIGQLVMMPLFFASSALYPLEIMPGWLKAVAHVNPLTYEVEGLRGFLLGGGDPSVDVLVCTGWVVVLAALATRAYPKRFCNPLLPSRAVCRRRPSWSARAATRRRRSLPPLA
jgi:hypothetical protein